MKTLRGRSGVSHTFAEVNFPPSGERVTDREEDEADEFDIIGLYARMIDVGAVSGEVVAPSFTLKARELASSYGIELKTEQDETASGR